MKPQVAITALDRQIAAHGQTVRLRRRAGGGAPIEVDVRAFVRGYKPSELVGGISQGDSLVILSPTSLVGTPFADELPDFNDRVEIEGFVRNVIMPDPVRVGGVVVRINLQVRGS